MAADSSEIVDRVMELEGGFRALRHWVTGPVAATSTALSIELRIFREVLPMGRRLLPQPQRRYSASQGGPSLIHILPAVRSISTLVTVW